MRWFVLTGLLCVVAGAGQLQAQAPDAPFLRASRHLDWQPVAEPRGGSEALLWGTTEGERAVLVSWAFNTRLPSRVRAEDLHLLVLAGTLFLQAGEERTEMGPGGYLTVPRGVEHVLGCEAAGQCVFLMHHAGRLARRADAGMVAAREDH